MIAEEVSGAFQRLAGSAGAPAVQPAVAAVLAAADDAAGTARGDGRRAGAAPVDAAAGAAPGDTADLLDALVLLRWAQAELAAVEPMLIRAARTAGVSWQDLAPALGVASRQAAERRDLRLAPAPPDLRSGTGDDRVRAERDRRAGHRAVAQWANDNTADLRRLAGQVTVLTDLGDDAAADLGLLHRALADADATALPGLLAKAQRHLGTHPELADLIDTVTDRADRVRQRTQQRRDGVTAADREPPTLDDQHPAGPESRASET